MIEKQLTLGDLHPYVSVYTTVKIAADTADEEENVLYCGQWLQLPKSLRAAKVGTIAVIENNEMYFIVEE